MTSETALAIHRNMLWADRRVAGLGAGGAAETVPPWLFIDPGMDFWLFNMAIPLGRELGVRAGPAVEVAAAWFAQRRLSQYRLVLREQGDSALVEAALAAGLTVHDEVLPAMALSPLDLAPAEVPAGLAIDIVRDDRGLDLYTTQFSGADPAWADVIRRIGKVAMSLHGFTLLLGSVDDQPVATSMAVVTGDTMGVYNVGVDPEFRRRGFGEAMSRAAVEVGLEAGCIRAGLQASAMGFPLYRRMGFRTVETYLSMSAPLP